QQIHLLACGPQRIGPGEHLLPQSQLPADPVFPNHGNCDGFRWFTGGHRSFANRSAASGKARKTEFFLCLPEQIETALLLDADTRVIGDVSLGFEKAEKHGIAMVPAPHYSLADYRDFRQVMLKEGVTPLGQITYTSGGQ